MDKGVKMPSKVKKMDLVTRLLMEESINRSMSGAVSGNNPEVKSGGCHQKVWIVETKERYTINWCGQAETETKIIGIYTNKADTIRNAKVSFTNMDMNDAMNDEDDDTMKMKSHGGVLCKLELEEGKAVSVEIRKADLNREIKSVMVLSGTQSKGGISGET
jgi:hypothetical protein